MKLRINKLIDARHQRGLTQQQVADGSGVSLMTISNAENGNHVQPATGKRILKFLKLNPVDAIVPFDQEGNGDAA
jgi:transcriptional regulator with XRE-family HTH domain